MGTIRKKVRAKGTVWEAMVRLKGAPLLSKSFTTKDEARIWITDRENIIHGGGVVSRVKLEKSTIAAVLEEYLDENRKRDSNGDTVLDLKGKVVYSGITQKKAYNIGWLSHHLGELTIETLTPKNIGKFFKNLLTTIIPPRSNRKVIHKNYNGAIEKCYAPATVRRYYFDLKIALEWWAKKYDFDLGKRFEDQDIPSNWETPRDRRLETGEEQRLLDACNNMYKAPRQWQLIISFAIETAMRASEILKLDWNDCHLEENKRFIGVRANTTKTRVIRQVPLSIKAIAILNELSEKSETKKGRVFEKIPHQAFSAGFKKLAIRAQCDNLIFHDLRHEAISRLFENNLNLSSLEIMLMSGHTQQSTILRYANLRPAILADKLDQKK